MIYFQERQVFPWWVFAILVGVVAVPQLLAMFLQSHVTLIVGLSVTSLILLLFGIMKTEVTQEELRVTFGLLGIIRFRYPLTSIVSVTARTYRPLVEFGGWGIRGFGRKRALNMSGNRGAEIQIVYKGGGLASIMIGSKRSEELAAAIQSAISKQ